MRLCFVFASRGAETIILRYLMRINLLSIYDMIDVCCRGVIFRDTVLSDRDMVMVVCEYFRCPPLRLLRQDILRLGMRLCGFHSSVEAISWLRSSRVCCPNLYFPFVKRRYLIFRLRILHFFDKFRDFSNILPCFVHYFALPNAHHYVKDRFFMCIFFVRNYKRVSRLIILRYLTRITMSRIDFLCVSFLCGIISVLVVYLIFP